MKKIIIILFLLPFIFTGCWDKVEIDRKIFVSTIGIDAGEDIEKVKELKDIKEGDPFQERSIKKYSITYAFPDISKLISQSPSGSEIEFINTDAYSMENGINSVALRSSRTFYFGQTKLLLISDTILTNKEVFREIIDFLERQHIMNRMMYVLVCKGKVEDFIKFKPVTEKNVEEYLSGLMINSKSNATILPVTLNELIILLRQNGNAILPEITIDKVKNQLYLSGVSVIKDYEIIGSLNPVEVTDAELIRGQQQVGSKVLYLNGYPVDFEIYGVKRRIKVQEINQKIIVNIKIGIEGEIKDYYVGGQIVDEDLIKRTEEGFNKSLSTECKKVAKITQSEFGVDVFKIRDYIEKFHPNIYKKVKDNWEEAYRNMDINIAVDTTIRRIGAIK